MVDRGYPLADDTRKRYHFTSGSAASTPEGVSTATDVYDAQAVHRGSPHQHAQYSLAAGVGDNDLFSIDPATGAVTFKTSPDYEHPADANHDNVYDVVVTARFGTHRIVQTVSISVTDVAPTAPVDSNPAANSVAAHAPTGTPVGITAASSDVSAVTYSITGDTSGGGFTVNPTNGVVSVADPSKINYETAPNHAYTITVAASDGTLSSSSTFTIAVTDVTPSTPVDANPAPNVVAEGAPVGTTVGLTASSTDVDGSAVTYSLAADSSGGGFTIDSRTGVVTVADPSKIDYVPSGGAFDVTVQAADPSGAAAAQTFAITLDPGSTFSYGPTPVVSKGQSAGETPSVSSPEGGDHFALASSGTGTYGTASVNATTGVVTYTATSAPAAGTAATDSFIVADTDAYGARTQATASFTVDGGTAFSYAPKAVAANGGSASEMPSVTSPEGGDGFAFASGGTSAAGTYGTATLDASTGVVTYTAYTGAKSATAPATDNFAVVDTDKYGAQTSATASFTADPGTAFTYGPPQPPVVAKGSVSIDTPSAPAAGDSFAFASGTTSGTGTYGTATVNATTGVVTYTATGMPTAGTTAPDGFTVVDTDKYGFQTSATATFTVDGGTAFSYPKAPAVPDHYGHSVGPAVTSSPEGGDTYAFAPGTSGVGTHGTATLDPNSGTLYYTATSALAAGTTAKDSFTIVDTDKLGAQTTATMTFIEDGGTAFSYTPAVVTHGQSDTEQANVTSSPEGGDYYIFASGTTSATGTYGTATLDASTGAVTYKATGAMPAAGTAPTDSFTIVDTDNNQAQTQATASFTVDGGTAFSYPTAKPVPNGGSTSEMPSVTSPEGGDSYAFASGGTTDQGTYGTATVNALGVVSYTASNAVAAGTAKTDSFQIVDTDKYGVQTNATATFTVDGGTAYSYTSAAPVAHGASASETVTGATSPEGGDTYAFATSGNGTYGTATVDAMSGTVTYTANGTQPAAGTAPTDAFTIVDTDAAGAKTNATATFTVDGGTSFSYPTPGPVVANGGSASESWVRRTSPEGGDTYTLASGNATDTGTYGTASVTTAGVVTYNATSAPTAGTTATDTFQIADTDKDGVRTTASATFTVDGGTAFSYTPATVANGLTVNETPSAVSPEGGDSYSLASGTAAYGTVAVDKTTGVVTYNATSAPAAGTTATESFTIADTDAKGAQTSATATFTVDGGTAFSYPAAQPAVVANGGSATDTPSVTKSPEGGDQYALASSSTGSYGTATVDASTGIVSYKATSQPTAGTTATDTFTVVDTDADGAKTNATATFTVDGGTAFSYAQAPAVANGQSTIEMPTVTASPEGGNTYAFASGTSDPGTYGTATVNPSTGVVSYTATKTPAAGMAATDSFVVIDTDADGAKTNATATFTVDGGTAFSYPTAAAVAKGGTTSDTPTVTSSPEGGDRYTFAAGTSGMGAYGTATVNATSGVVSYTASGAPAAGMTATDSFAIVDTDRDGVETTAMAAFTVDGGTAFSYAQATVAKGETTTEAASKTSPEGGDSFSLASGTPTYGTVAVNATTGDVSYTATSAPAAGTTATQTFTIADTDRYGATTSATATFTVDGGSVFSYPTASVVAKGHGATDTPSLGTSPEGGDTYSLTSGSGTYGTAMVNASSGIVAYAATGQPAAGTTATDSFTVVDTDGAGATTSATASFTVDGGTAFSYTSAAPVANGAATSETLATKTSPEGSDSYAFATSGTGTYGTATLDATTGTVTYLADGTPPAAGTAKTDSFTIVDTDAAGAKTNATATFTVDGGTAFSYPTQATVMKGGQAMETPAVTSPEGGDTYSLASGTGTYGTATVNPTTGVVTYIATGAPAAGMTSPDGFSVVDTDRYGVQTSATATFEVQGVSPPTAKSFTAQTNENTAETITLSATDPNSGGAISSYTVTSLPSDGTLYTDSAHAHAVTVNTPLTSPTLYFQPTSNYAGTGSFHYTATDGTYGVTSAPATVTLDVAPVAQAPTFPSLATPQPTAATNEFQVNTTTAGIQNEAAVTALSNGGYVVAWQDTNTDGLQARVYNAAGVPQSSDFSIAVDPSDTLVYASNAVVLNGISAGTYAGDFLETDVVQNTGNSAYNQVEGRIISPSSEAAVKTFNVSPTTANDRLGSVSSAVFSDGSFVVAYQDTGYSPSLHANIEVQRFTAAGATENQNGTAVSGGGFATFQANTTGIAENPDVATLSNGNFVVAWDSSPANANNTHDVFYSVYNSSGVALAGQQMANTTTANDQIDPSVAALAGGGFVMSWTSDTQISPSVDSAIYFQRFDANGNKVGSETLASNSTTVTDSSSNVVALPDGGFLVTWDAPDSTNNSDVMGQRFDANGVAVGTPFTINQTTAGNQEQHGPDNQNPQAVLNSGQLVSVWDGAGNGSDQTGIYGRTFSLPDDGPQNGAVALTTLNASVSDPSETLSYILSGFPAGTTFSVNGHTTGALDTNPASPTYGDWVISSSADITALKTAPLTLTSSTAGPFTLTVDARATQTATLSDGTQHTSTSDVTKTIQVGVKAPGDPIFAADTAAPTALHLDAVAQGDTVTITGVPDNGDLLLANGTAVHQNDVLSADQFAGLVFKPVDVGNDTSSAFQFTVSDGTTDTVNTIPVYVTHGSALTLNGSVGEDHLIGNPGADVLIGHGGHDILTGGGGADHFVFDQTALAGSQAAEITDYSAKQGDVIDVSAIAAGLHSGHHASGLFHVQEDAGGTFATLDVNTGTHSAPHWVEIAQLDGLHPGDVVNLSTNSAHPAASIQMHVDAHHGLV